MKHFKKTVLSAFILAAAMFHSSYAQESKSFYLLPPHTRDWIEGIPYIMDASGNAKPMAIDQSNCGWYKAAYFEEEPPARMMIGIGPTMQQPINRGIFNLAQKFDELGNEIYFHADNDQWLTSRAAIPEESDRCSYLMAAIIYDTDKSVNSSFTENDDDIGVGGDQYGFWTSGIIKNMVKKTLNDDRKIECDQCDSKAGGFKSKEDFRKAFDPNDNSNVVVCYDMPFQRSSSGLWEFDSDKMLNNQGKTVGGFFPEILQNRVLATAAGANYDNCPGCDRKYPAESFVGLNLSKVNPWCFERGLQTSGTNVTGTTLSACGSPYGEISGGPNSDRGSYSGKALGHFAHGGWPADTWGHTPQAGSNEYNNNWNSEWRNANINLWGGSYVGANAKSNPFFCFESHAEFKYDPAHEFFFRGDDDIWVYINNKLVVDLGGTKLAAPGYVKLDALGLTEGQTYPIDIFFCDRRTSMSNIRIATNMYFSFSQNTGLFVNGNAETSDAPICLNKSGGGGCAAAVGGESGSSQQCGSEIANNLHYYMQRRDGDRTGLDLDPVNNPNNCNQSGGIITCYSGIIINTANGTIKVEKSKISGGDLAGTYFIYVEAKDPNVWQPTPPPRQVTRFAFGDDTPIRLPQIASNNKITQVRNGLNLQVNDNAVLEVYGLKGNLISRQNFKSGVYLVSLDHLPKGMYIVKSSFGNRKQTLRMLVM